ncbi:MAG TPA: tRNA (adenosine(37)-N6)-dimethylallyltransferase MiaA [Thermomicrobiaceae bacterium]|nr:tRNA (adenosine(37)-N6)-dimethylallyltransferase MiaA [Thermomicrobiaceae bacterium]
MIAAVPSQPDRPNLIAIVGPTAAGKTAAAIRLARDVGGEVVSADSRYLYRGMDVGTAKPTCAEMAGVPHHLIDVVGPADDYSLALYQRDAYAAIDDIVRRGRVPILAGGTPLYVNAVLEGWQVPEVPPDAAFREAMAELARVEGTAALHARLAAVDPVAAARIAPANARRVIRALEIFARTGRRMSELEGKRRPPYRTLVAGLMPPRAALYAAIDRRVADQIAGGLIDEVRRLLDDGVPPGAPAMSAIGYGEIVDYLAGRLTLEQAAERIRHHTHRYARHQLTWLRRMRGVHWFDPGEPGWYERLRDLAATFLAENETGGDTTP